MSIRAVNSYSRRAAFALTLPLLSPLLHACGETATEAAAMGAQTGTSAVGTGASSGGAGSMSSDATLGSSSASATPGGSSSAAGITSSGVAGAVSVTAAGGAPNTSSGGGGTTATLSSAGGGADLTTGAGGMAAMVSGSGGTTVAASGAGGVTATNSIGGMANATGGAGGMGGTGGAAGASSGTGGTAGLGAGTAGAGTAGAGGSGDDALAIAANIHQFRLECPCIDADHFGPDKQDNCDAAPEVDRQTYEMTIDGDSDSVYNVTLRVRGLTEPNIYGGGTLNPPRFYVGGQTTQSGYTAYSLTVADPAQVYFFNYSDSVGHFVFELDYEAVIPMRGGTTVTFDVNGQQSVPDGHGVSNRDSVVIDGVPPAPEPFNGQFVQFDVVSVEIAQ